MSEQGTTPRPNNVPANCCFFPGDKPVPPPVPVPTLPPITPVLPLVVVAAVAMVVVGLRGPPGGGDKVGEARPPKGVEPLRDGDNSTPPPPPPPIGELMGEEKGAGDRGENNPPGKRTMKKKTW